VTGPGVTFWGLFVACAVILVAYTLWMIWTERDE
jgi:hypothetical protein